MLYNQTKTSCGTVMPLLMGCTRPQPIETAADAPQIYDPITQSVMYDMRIVGTYSLKSSCTDGVPSVHRVSAMHGTQFRLFRSDCNFCWRICFFGM